MQETEWSPRICNTGAQNTTPLPLRSLIDWVSATFSDDTPPERVSEILGIPFSYFVQMERGHKGYRKHYRFGHIAIYLDGAPGMGTHLELSGKVAGSLKKYLKTIGSIFSSTFY